MDALLLLIRIFLAAVFGLAGIGKLIDLDGSRRAVREFGVPELLAKPLGFLLPVFEIALAIMFLPVATSFFAAIGSATLLAVFIGAMIWHKSRGNAPDCHCFGVVHSEPVSLRSILRNVAFALLAAMLIWRGPSAQGLGLGSLQNDMVIQLAIGLAVVALLGAAVFYLRKISTQQTEIMRRIELLEIAGVADGSQVVKRDDTGHPDDTLPIGAVAPDFALRTAGGGLFGLDNVIAAHKPALLFFVGPTCAPCASLVPEIAAWRDELGANVEFVLLSSGEAATNMEKFADTNVANLLLQEHREVAELYHARWTPTAVFLNADGLIASRLAVGDAAIRDLIHMVRKVDFTQQSVFLPNASDTKIGQPVPEVSVSSIDGAEISADSFRGRKTLVAFWSTTCPHCLKMIRDLQEWDRTKGGDEPNLVLFSDGDADEHREFGLASPIVIDPGYKTAEKFGMFGTPSAVLINENGRFVSETAVGAANIWALLGRKP